MANVLAIACPVIGAPSETFVRRHMEDLLPNSSVVIAHTASEPYGGHWQANCPTLVTDTLKYKTPLHTLGASIARKLDIIDFDIQTVSAVKEFLKRHKVEIILGEYLSTSFDFFRISKKLNIPYFAHAHGVDISANLRQPKWQKKYLEYREAAGIITISELSRARLIQLGLDPASIHVIPCGVDVPSTPTLRDDQTTIRCLAVGRMVPKKAPLLLLESFRLAASKNPNLRLDYVGAGPLFETAKQYIHEYQLGERITLHAAQSSTFIQNLMKQSDIFLQHSVVDSVTGDEEGLPVSILEAMANALPVVSTRHAGIPEAVLEEKTGFLVDEGDVFSMARHIELLSKDYDLRISIGSTGWQRAKALFTWQKERKSILEVMQLKDCSCL